MSRFAINSYAYILNHTAEACLTELAGLGFTDFELMMYPGHAWPNDMDAGARRRFKAFLRDGGHRIVSVNQPNIDLNIAAGTREMRAYSLDILRSIIDFMGEMEIPAFVLGPGKQNPLMPAPREHLMGCFYKALDLLQPRAEAAGVMLMVENMPFAFLPDAESLMAALEAYGDPRIRVIYDIANAAFIKEDVLDGLRRVRPRLEMVHVSDTGPRVYRHDPIGRGTIDFAKVRRDLDAVDWHRKPVLEIIALSDSPKDDLLHSVARLQDLGW